MIKIVLLSMVSINEYISVEQLLGFQNLITHSLLCQCRKASISKKKLATDKSKVRENSICHKTADHAVEKSK